MLLLQRKENMKNEIDACCLCDLPLFDGIKEEERAGLAACICSGVKVFKKNDIIITEGDSAAKAGIVQKGRTFAYIIGEDGGRIFMASHLRGDIFGEVVMFAKNEGSPVTVEAAEESEILMLDREKILNPCEKACGCHVTLLKNLLISSADKFAAQRVMIATLCMKKLCGKIAAALIYFSRKAGSDTFNLPFDRAAFADYLGADRSALSRELSRLRKIGAIDFYKNSFKILDRKKLCGKRADKI